MKSESLETIFEQATCEEGKGFCSLMVQELRLKREYILFLNISASKKTNNPLEKCSVMKNGKPLVRCPFCNGSL